MANETYALFDTSEGSFKVKLYADRAPNTVQNFTDLAEGKKTGKPFYDGQIFHRAVAAWIEHHVVIGGIDSGQHFRMGQRRIVLAQILGHCPRLCRQATDQTKAEPVDGRRHPARCGDSDVPASRREDLVRFG